MVRLPRAVAAISPILLLAGALTAAAEPISFTFNVGIQYRCTRDGCDSYSASFPVTMTLDRAVSRSRDNASSRERWFGVPSFSRVPLARPEVAPSAKPMNIPAVEMLFVHNDGWRHVAQAYDGLEMTGPDDTYYNWNTTLYRLEDNVWPLPPLSARAMAAFLGGRGDAFFGFNFSGVLADGALTPDSVGYVGGATLVHETAPVPEPATMLLIGSGLAVLYRRTRGRQVL